MARRTQLRFPSATGESLAAVLESPAEQEPHAIGLFAHCFSCSKDSLAAARVSRALALRGWGVLRLDFTGLGASEGDFAETSFSTNLDDLRAAAAFLTAEHGEPRLLVGHSLGGAAVLAAAAEIPGVRAVATIGAPSDTAHVTRLLGDAIGEIRSRGEATIDLGGRPFCIRRQFVEDLTKHDLLADVGALDRPLLIMHSPVDTIVSIEHAAALYGAARHPKSFVSLDDADHLLSRGRDSSYAATVLDAWASRYTRGGG